MKRILLISEIAGYNYALSEGLKDLGLKADYIDFQPNIYTDRKQKPNLIPSLLKLLKNKKKDEIFGFLIDKLYSHVVFVYGGRSFIEPSVSIEKNITRINKLFGKKTKKIFVFNGSDARPPIMNGIYINTLSKETPDPLLYLKEQSEITNHCVEIAEAVADKIIAQPHHNSNITKSFANFCTLGLGIKEIYNLKPNETKHNNPERIIIQHSPSNRKGKGSDVILEVINEIKEEGFNIEYREIHNKPHQEVCKGLCEAHILIDQLYSDIPLTAASSEGAFYNCFTIMGGYQLEKTLATMPENLRPNLHYIQPSKEELKNILIKAITDRNFRKSEADKQTAFVKQYCTPKSFAERFLKIIKTEAPESWYIKTEEPSIETGCVISKQEMVDNLKCFVSRFGIKATKIKNKKLLQKLKELCAE